MLMGRCGMQEFQCNICAHSPRIDTVRQDILIVYLQAKATRLFLGLI